MSTSKHVPAWKRLGIKLKYAKESAEEPSSTPEQKFVESPKAIPEDGQKRRLADTEVNATISTKRQKLSPEATNETPPRSDRPTSTPNASEPRRKSVTFTPGTKTEDGFSASRIFKQWIPSRDPGQQFNLPPHRGGSDISPSPSPEKKASKSKLVVEDTAVSDPVGSAPSKKDSKKLKRQNKALAGRTDPAIAKDVPDYLNYLIQFHEHKDTWKFNKKKQNDLFKHFFDTVLIPPRYNPALLAYLSGLNGAHAQKRLLDAAEVILQNMMNRLNRTKDVAGMEDPKDRQLVYQAAMNEEFERWESMRGQHNSIDDQAWEDAKKQRDEDIRADETLKVILLNYLHPQSNPLPAPPTQASTQTSTGPKHMKFDDTDDQNTGATQPAKKKSRKARTVEVESSSSSSSSSESSDSSSDASSESSSEDESHVD